MEESRNISSHLRCEHGLIVHAFTETSQFWAWARGMDALFQEVLANFVKKGKAGMVALCGFTDRPRPEYSVSSRPRKSPVLK